MTINEKKYLLKTWTLIGLIIGCLGGAAGWGISVGLRESAQQVTTRDVQKLQSEVTENRKELYEVRVALAAFGRDISYIRKAVENPQRKSYNEN